MIVIRLSRVGRNPSATALPIKKGSNDWVYYDVYLSPPGEKLVKDYFCKFPEIIDYMKDNIDRWNKKFALPRMHDVIFFDYSDQENLQRS